MTYLILFVLGLAVGSFLNVMVYRIKKGESFITGRSHCDQCQAKIGWYDNIPLLSFLILKGRCRKCQRKIPVEYPLTELLIGIEFVWVYWLLSVNFNFFNSWEGFYSLALLIYWLILFSGSIGIIIFDLKYMLIPDEILYPLIGLALLRLPFSGQWQVIWTALGSFIFIYSLYLLTKKKGMGFGDIKLAVLLGLVLGWPKILVAYLIAFLTGAVVGVILIIRGKKKLKDRIAFGPFLLLAMLAAKLWGETIWQWYLKVLLY
ncbi:MAG: prepilin peptidase [Candidatus Beckwithbacteria bacterium]